MSDTNADSDLFLILHGWGGNKPAHWQERLVVALAEAGADVHYPKMPDPMSPDRAAWASRLDEELAALAPKVVAGGKLAVLAHSLGAINWLHYASRYATMAPPLVAERVLLIAPPYVIPEIPPTDAPPGVPGFFPPPLSPEGIAAVARETHFIASDSDDYATFEQTKAYSDRVGVPIHLLPGAGHISPYWGYGDWPWVVDWCLRRATLPPLPRVTD